MKKEYIAPSLNVYGKVEAITELQGKTDKNDFTFFNGSPVINDSTGLPATGDGSIDDFLA